MKIALCHISRGEVSEAGRCSAGVLIGDVWVRGPCSLVPARWERLGLKRKVRASLRKRLGQQLPLSLVKAGVPEFIEEHCGAESLALRLCGLPDGKQAYAQLIERIMSRHVLLAMYRTVRGLPDSN
jgi:hypothetical protein